MDSTNDRLTESFLTNDFGDKYLYSANHNSLNKLGAAETHRSRFDTLCETKDTLFIVIGSDSGTLLTYLRSRTIASGSLFILIEPPDIFERIQQELQPPPDQTIMFISVEDFDATIDAINFKSYVFIDKVQLTKSTAADYAFIPDYYDLFFSIQSKTQQLVWSIQTSLGIQPFIKTQLANLSENSTSSIALKNFFASKTAVLLAGGPSLDEILPWVIDKRDALVIMAVSRVCRRLLDVSLQPDIIFSIDPHQVSFDVSKEMLNFCEQSIFINHVHASPLLLAQWSGRRMFLGNRFPWPSEMNPPTISSAGPTVSNTALATAVAMGFSQVILAGVDLCHSKQGYTHAKGSNEHQAGPQLGKAGTQVLTNGGWMAETTSDFATARDILSVQAKKAQQQNVQFINPAQGAAKVDHVRHAALDDIRLTSISPSPREELAKVAVPLTAEQYQNDLQGVANELIRAEGQLRHILKLGKEALRCNEGLFGRKGRKRDFKYKKQMDKIERKLNRNYGDFSRFVKQYGLRDFIKITRVDKSDNWEHDEIENTAATYYEAYTKNTKELLQLIKQSKQRIQARLEEEKLNPDFSLLCNQWQHDNQPGRLLVWLRHHNMEVSGLPAEIQPMAHQLHDQFEAIMDSTAETEHMKRSKEYADLGNSLRGKIQMYYQKKDLETLQNLSTTLSQHPEAKAKKFLYLAQGYLHELQNSPDLALDTYQLLFDQEDELFLEDALQRIASISLQNEDIENALLALETLARISPSYLVRYGDLLRLTGEHQKALAAYLDYLEKAPKDLSLMLKLGQYYRKLNITEGAKAMYLHVLQLDPQNSTAEKLLQDMQR